MKKLADYLARVKITVKDDASRFTDAEKQDMIREAVRHYTRARPRRRTHDLVGDGSRQEFPTPPGWEDGFSQVVAIQRSPDINPPEYLDLQDNLAIIERSDREWLQLTWDTPASGTVYRVYYTAPHVVTADEGTIRDHDFDAVCNLAASRLARALALFYAESTQSTIGADNVDQLRKAEVFASLSKALFEEYQEHVPDLESDLVFHDMDTRFPWGTEYLFHRRRHY